MKRLFGGFFLMASVISGAFGVPSSVAQEIRLEASVNAARVGLEDILQLTVSVHGDSSGRVPEPVLPALAGFDVAGRSSSSQVQIVNGQMSATRAYIYSLIPKAEGVQTIAPAELEFQGTVYRTESIQVEVVPGKLLPGRAGAGNLNPFGGRRGSPFSRRREPPPTVGEDQLFVQAELSKRDPFIGEQLVVSYRLYTKVNIMGVEVDEDPSMSGFWVEEVTLPRDQQLQPTTYRGERWHVVTIKQRVVFPTREGELEIPPVTFSMAVRSTTGDPFDSFFFRASEPVARSTARVLVNASALPAEGRPSDFSGAVGEYSLGASLNRDAVEAGEAVSLNVSLEGSGNLRTVDAPRFETPAGFRTFDPKTEESLRASATGFGGSKRWEYVLVPESGGTKEVGPVRFVYFDPDAEKYEIASLGPLSLDVSGSALASDGSPVGALSRGQVRVLRSDIRFLKAAPSRFGRSGGAFYRSPWFFLSLTVPLFANLGLAFVQWRNDSQKGDTKRFRRERAEKMARARLKQARALASQASQDFYEETSAAMYRYIADKQGASASGLTASRIDAFLDEREVAAPLRRQLLELLAECDRARFTPGERSSAEMESVWSRAVDTIAALEKQG